MVFVGLLAYKVWNVTRRTFQYRSSDGLAPVLRVAIESGAIYTATMSAGLVLFLLQSKLVYTIIDTVCKLAFLKSSTSDATHDGCPDHIDAC